MRSRPETGSIPDAPGSYQFRDAQGRVIYVGKAKSLRSRVASYFGAPEALPPRTRQMVAAADSVEWIEVNNEVEALFLEYNLIKRHRPRFNIRLKDDKSYPFLAVTLDEEWPRAMVMRGAKRRGVRYFGPYAHAYAIRETLDLLLRTFPVRTCTRAKFDRHRRLGRPCLYAHIEKCAAPCVGAVDREAYDALVGELITFLDGDTAPVLDRLEKQMHGAAEALEYERAARLRDQLASVRKVVERQQMVGSREEDLDVVGLVDDPLEASVQVFLVRRGRVVGRRGLVVDKVEDVDPPALVGRLLGQLYGGAAPEDVPREVLVPVEPEDRELHEAFLAAARGSRVRIRVPQRGAKRELLATVTRNAEEAHTRHKLRRASDHNARARALMALQEALGLPEAPLRIECFDVSNLQGTEIVASMVVMEDGLAKRSDYRRFRVRHQQGQDDLAAMEEALTRRFRRYLDERDEGARAGKRFAYPPNLLLVDGGKGQLDVATRVLEELGLEEISVAALAKRFEEVHRPGREAPVRIARDSEALYLLQQVRDEAHRFAVTYHRQLRGKRMTRSVLDDVPGLGPARRKRLLKEHGSVKRLRALTEDELVSLPWLPDRVARALYAALHGEAGSLTKTSPPGSLGPGAGPGEDPAAARPRGAGG
ncbi:MAG: excinuclease ABC subunit UvrC [Acidimicrobiia bacterium]|nr:excinuclease ABC subunit UvrC [Acidimicrobiia bacterium]